MKALPATGILKREAPSCGAGVPAIEAAQVETAHLTSYSLSLAIFPHSLNAAAG
jgi:hypothetical protein